MMAKQYLKFKLWIIPVLLIWMAISTSCERVEGGEDQETPALPQATVPVATLEDNQSSSEDGEPEDLSTPQSPEHLVSGLVLGSMSETFYVDLTGQVVLLVDQTLAQLNADHDLVLFAREDPANYKNDIWILDLESGEEQNLTQTPDRDEIFPQWWPAHPEMAFFVSGEETGMMNSEQPTIVNLDGSGYQVLDENQGGPNTLASDGTMIAYGGFDQVGVIYHWDGKFEDFYPEDYGLNVEKIFQPAFSPDGRFLAWKVAGDLNGDGSYAIGLAIFDLQERTAILTHVYIVQGGGMVPHYVAWSPDGSWIAYVTFGEGPAVEREPNLWILRPDGSQEMFVDIGLDPTWSPDGSSLAYIRTTMEGEQGLQIMDLKSLSITPIDDLSFPGALNFIIDWIQP
ncbi:MAG: hypothetical protein WBB69_03415 [Anaerolineales bacterium]